MIRRVVFGLVLCSFSTKNYAVELLVGPAFGHRTLTITEDSSSIDVAEFQSGGISISPYVSLRTDPFYLGHDSNWGITFSADFFVSS